MKSEQKQAGHTSHLIAIRRQQRQDQTQQLKNTLRFHAEFNTLLQESQNDPIVPELSQDQIQELLQRQDHQGLFTAIINGTDTVIETIENNIAIVLEWVFSRLSTPTGALALERLCRRSEMAVAAVFEEGRFSEITAHLKRLTKGAREQNIYLSCISCLLERESLVETFQLASLFPIAEEYFYQQIQMGRQHTLTILVVSQLITFSTPKMRFSQDFLIDFQEWFWKVENEINYTRIFLSAVHLANLRVYDRSITLLIAEIRVLLRGRARMPQRMERDIPPTLTLLTSIFQFHQERQDTMEEFGFIRIDGQMVKTSLHGFLLNYQPSIFQQDITSSFLEFLLAFCQIGPVVQICEAWERIGLIERIIGELSSMGPTSCFLALRVCLGLLRGGGVVFCDQAGRLLKSYLIEDSIAEVLQNFTEPRIRSIATEIAELLATK